jgi:hypothetical protein
MGSVSGRFISETTARIQPALSVRGSNRVVGALNFIAYRSDQRKGLLHAHIKRSFKLKNYRKKFITSNSP